MFVKVSALYIKESALADTNPHNSGCTFLAAPKLPAQGGGDKKIRGVNILFEYYLYCGHSL